mmetsp:Transcript_5873/g.26412  ORF Transcript_5873/g.26412 Transcript_5873/m.26412 type:complete len:243 (+) Transcript_5873:99-827(+)
MKEVEIMWVDDVRCDLVGVDLLELVAPVHNRVVEGEDGDGHLDRAALASLDLLHGARLRRPAGDGCEKAEDAAALLLDLNVVANLELELLRVLKADLAAGPAAGEQVIPARELLGVALDVLALADVDGVFTLVVFGEVVLLRLAPGGLLEGLLDEPLLQADLTAGPAAGEPVVAGRVLGVVVLDPLALADVDAARVLRRAGDDDGAGLGGLSLGGAERGHRRDSLRGEGEHLRGGVSDGKVW